jgi:hypothetical protein
MVKKNVWTLTLFSVLLDKIAYKIPLNYYSLWIRLKYKHERKSYRMQISVLDP